MLFIFRLLRAKSLKKKLKEYMETRKMSIEDEERKYGCCGRFKLWWRRKCPFFLGGGSLEGKITYSALDKFRIKLFKQGTYENYVMKSVIGFLSGILLTYMFFIFFVLQLNFPLGSATAMCSVFGLVLSLGLAYSYRVRCIVFMLLPQFFSKRGRQALVAYAFILTLTGPAKNTLRNMRVLSESMACGQGKLKAAVKNLVDVIKKPFYAIKDSMKMVMEKVKVVVEKVKEIINTLKKIVKSLVGVIKSAYDWLNSIVSICSKKLGTPYQRCGKAFEEAYDDCIEKVPYMFNSLCKVTELVKGVCIIVKPFDYICELFDFVSDEIVDYVKKKLSEFTSQMKNIFYVSVKFSHNFDFKTDQSKTVKEIAASIMLEIKQRSEKIVYFFNWMNFVFSFFFLYMLIQVLNYKRKYMSIEWFDNHFITENIIHIDIQRTRRGLETILPLNVHERKKYVQVSSIRLVANERRALAKSAIFLGLSTVKLSIHMLTDYSLWWILQMIRYHGQFQTNIDNPSNINVVVDGKGMLADLYASILNAFQPTGVKFDLDTTPCLPDPIPPDLPRYRQIGSLIILAWILSILQPYGLRLRNAAMGYYYPARARVRAVWLYNHILRSRGSFLKYARRQLRRMFIKDGQGVEKISLMDRLKASFPIFQKICRGKPLSACLLCGGVGSSELPLVKCPRPDCIGIYCVPCYSQLQNLCTLCKLPIEYGDLSDMSEERDSSDEVKTSISSKPIEEGASTSESDSTGALLQDTAESDMSFNYQYKDRDVNEDRSAIPPGFIDVEAQKPRTRASLNDFTFPIDHRSEEDEPRMTLAQRKESSIWPLARPTDEPHRKQKKIDIQNNKEHVSVPSKRKSVSFKTSAANIQSRKEESSELEASTEGDSELEEYEHNEDDTSEESEETFKTSSRNVRSLIGSKGLKKTSKLNYREVRPLFLSKIKGFSRKRNETEIEGKKSDLSQHYSPYERKSPAREYVLESRRSLPEGTRISYLKNKLFGTPSKNVGTEDEGNSTGSEFKEKMVLSSKSKSSDLVKNWVKTGSYHELEPVEDSIDFQTNIPTPRSRFGALIDFFKRFFKKNDQYKENIANIPKHSYPRKVRKRSKKSNLPEKYKLGKFWGLWRRKTIKNENDASSAEDTDEKTKKKFSVTSRTIQHVSFMRIENEGLISTKRTQTPAKIVHERFKIDEYYL